MRDDSQKMQLGNRVSAMFVDLPVGEIDPVERLRRIRATTEDLKDREQAVGAAFLVDLTQFAAPTLLGLAARVAHRQPFFNVVITNVPGPQVPLYSMGARMLEAYPVVPLTRNLALGIAILSYCGQLHFGLYVDADAVGGRRGARGRARRRVRGADEDRTRGRRGSGGDGMTDLWARDAWELADDVRKGNLSAAELLEVSLDRIEQHNEDLNAVCYLDADAARARAQEIDAEVAVGRRPGPVRRRSRSGVKELAQAKGFPDTHASVMYKDRVAAVDGTEVASAACRRRGDRRADHRAGDGHPELHELAVARDHAQPVEPRGDAGWLVRRFGGGGCVGDAARRAPGATAAARSASRPRTPGFPASRAPSG